MVGPEWYQDPRVRWIKRRVGKEVPRCFIAIMLKYITPTRVKLLSHAHKNIQNLGDNTRDATMRVTGKPARLWMRR